MRQRVINNIGLPYLLLETEDKRPIATMTIQHSVMPDLLRVVAHECFLHSNAGDRDELIAIIGELQSLL